MTPPPKDPKPAKSLDHLLGQNEHVEVLVTTSAEDLALVNKTLRRELADHKPEPGIETALGKSKVVEVMVQEASERLADVNQALKEEVMDREILEDELAAVKAQGETDRHASLHDLLTGLPNRVLFNDRLEHGLAQAQRHGWTLAVMFVDLDNFKAINDSYGHDAGDAVLRTIAGRLLENTREDDTVSRHGGDEFLYLLMEVRDEEDIKAIAEKLRQAIQEPFALTVGVHGINPSIQASIGISIFPRHGTTPELLISKADSAMYEAKRNKTGYAFSG